MSTHLPSRPVLSLTPGEPAGIGPDICVMLAQDPPAAELVVIADPELLEDRARRLGLPLELHPYKESGPAVSGKGRLTIIPVELAAPAEPGRLDPRNAPYILETLRQAVDGCRAGRFAGMVTGPVHKGVINDAGIPFTGHTEFLAERCGVDRPVMMLATEGLRVALVTTHLPLTEVSAHISREAVTQVTSIVNQELQTRLGIARPRLLVCGLNPHAGEGGHLGREEIEIIEPALRDLRAHGIEVMGPLPADTLFTPKYLRQADAVIAMYHDQGLPVLKHMGFGRAVNITLGLPIVRTSVDHGTALDLAGSGRADPSSLRYAVDVAIQFCGGRPA